MMKKRTPKTTSALEIMAHANALSLMLSKTLTPMDRMAVLLFAMVDAAFDQVVPPKRAKKRTRKAKKAKQR